MFGQRWKYYSEDKSGQVLTHHLIKQNRIPFIENKIRNNITYFSKNELERISPKIKANNYVEVLKDQK